MLLDLRTGITSCVMSEILGETQAEDTDCEISFDSDTLHIVVNGTDGEMSNLISTPDADNDRFLYEEDCIQVAVATSAGREQALINAVGSRAGTTGSQNWQIKADQFADGWQVSVDLPIEPGADCIGINLHRFYRGCKNEIHGLDASLPHPLCAAEFTVLIIGGTAPATDIEARYRAEHETASEQALSDTLACSRERIANARQHPGQNISLDTAIELAHQRGAIAVRPGEGYLSWNEAYYLGALIDLWELTRNREWIELAIPRIEQVWALRSDRTDTRDSVTNCVLPTWYNDTETGAPCTLSSGTVLNPIARLLRTMHEDDLLTDMRETVSKWIPLCDQTLCLHDNEWMEFPDGSGMHIEPYQKGPRRVYPSGGSRINPLNREFWFSMPMLNLGIVTGNSEYLRKVSMNALYFKNTSDVTDDCSCWEYEASRYHSVGEDISHAQSQWQFAELCQRDGIVFTHEDLERIANMFERNIFKHGDVPCGTVRGLDPGLHLAVGVWSSICRYKPHLLTHIESVVSTVMKEKGDAFSDGWSIRNLTCLLKAQAEAT